MNDNMQPSKSWAERSLNTYARRVIAIAIALALVSFLSEGFKEPGPAKWLVDWTSWALAFFGLAFGGRTLWWSSEDIKNRVQGKSNRGGFAGETADG
jgi:hypothetical protein